jgi:hypothetical protein
MLNRSRCAESAQNAIIGRNIQQANFNALYSSVPAGMQMHISAGT